jgi:molybdate transport system substrate-binding protein
MSAGSKSAVLTPIAAALVFTVSFMFFPVAHAAEIRLLSSNVFTGVLDEPVSRYGRSAGQSVAIIYDTAGAIRNRIRDGELADATILPRPMMDDLLRAGKIAPGITDLARSAVGLAVRTGSAKPDIGSVEAVKRSLLAVDSISYADPAQGGATGVLVTRMFERLGITADMKPKTKVPARGQFAVELVARGEAELALAQSMEALGEPALELVGLLPPELQDPPGFTFSLGVLSAAKQQPAALALVEFISGPAVASALKARGMEPR